APVLSCVITWRGRIETKSPARTTVPAASPSACRAAIFSTSVRSIKFPLERLLPSGALAKKLGDIEVYEIGVMEDDRLDGAFHLVAFMTVRGDHVHHLTRNAVLVSQSHAGERMPHLLPKCALNHFARYVLIELQ